MNLHILESKSPSPRRARTLPSWLSAVGSSSNSKLPEDRSVDSSRPSRNPSANVTVAEVSSCDDAVMIPSSSTNTNTDQSTVGEIQAVETVFVAGSDDMNFIREDDDSAASGQSADSTNVEVGTIKIESGGIDSRVQVGDQIDDEDAHFSITVPSSSGNIPVCASSSPLASADTSILPGRPMCLYGGNCYRTNAQHKIDFSHPNDVDYGAQPECDSTSSNSTVTKPRCWYGSNCYRKNEEHRQKFSHSPLRTNRNTTQTRRENSNEQENSDEYDDSFIDDDDFSDDFGNNSSEEIKGFSDFEDYSSSDNESYEGPGKPKKKKFSIL